MVILTEAFCHCGYYSEPDVGQQLQDAPKAEVDLNVVSQNASSAVKCEEEEYDDDDNDEDDDDDDWDLDEPGGGDFTKRYTAMKIGHNHQVAYQAVKSVNVLSLIVILTGFQMFYPRSSNSRSALTNFSRLLSFQISKGITL